MILVNYQTITETDALVTRVYYEAETLTTEDKGVNYFEVETIPNPVITAGKNPELHVNPVDKTFWYVYTDAPKTPEERIADLEAENTAMKAENAAMKAALDDIILNGIPV